MFRTVMILIAWILSTHAAYPSSCKKDSHEHAQENVITAESKQVFENRRVLAKQGDRDSQGCLGYMYFYGIGTSQNAIKAFRWYRKSAAQNNPVAQHNLALMLDLGQGIPPDANAARKWYLKAAQNGISRSQLNLAIMYHEGRPNFPKDWERAAFWYEKARQHGDIEGDFNLAIIYLEHGTKRDLEKVFTESTLKAEQGLTSFQVLVAILLATGQGVDRDLDKASYWFEEYIRATSNCSLEIQACPNLNPNRLDYSVASALYKSECLKVGVPLVRD